MYLSGLMNIASSLSEYIGLSYIRVDCYDKETFEEEFLKNYKVKINLNNLEKSSKSLEKELEEWFGTDKKIIESLIYWIDQEIKGEKIIYYSNKDIIEKLSGYNRGLSGLYIVEDVLFIECNKKILIFMLGNNE